MVLLRSRSSRRRSLDAPFPPGLPARLSRAHPLLDDAALGLVEQGLRQWFAVCQKAEGEQLAMPSVVVDDLWHELIVHTVAYQRFCQQAFGRFLHHTPEEAMAPQDAAANGGARLRRTHELACDVEGTSLPLLFRVDALLRVHRGRSYVEDCGAFACGPPPATTCLRHLPAASRDRSGDGGPVWAWGGDGGSSRSGTDGWGSSDGSSDGGGGGCGGGGCGGGS